MEELYQKFITLRSPEVRPTRKEEITKCRSSFGVSENTVIANRCTTNERVMRFRS